MRSAAWPAMQARACAPSVSEVVSVIPAGNAAGDVHQHGLAHAGFHRAREAGFQAAFLVELFDPRRGQRGARTERQRQAADGALRRQRA